MSLDFQEFHINNQRFVAVPYENGSARSGMPLGGLGTGYIEIMSDGSFGKSTLENNFLTPSPVSPSSYLFLEIDGRRMSLNRENIRRITFLGHFPIADILYEDEKLPFSLSLRAFSPFIKNDELTSSIPCALFRFSLTSPHKSTRLKIGISWAVEENQKTGNLAGTLGWQKDALEPGEEWKTICAIYLGENESPTLLPPSFKFKGDKKGERISDGRTSLKVNDWGAFNWEEGLEFTFPYEDKGHLAAIFYSLRWEEGSCGTYYLPGGIGKENLVPLREVEVAENGRAARSTLKTEDGRLEVTIISMLQDGVLWRETSIKNISPHPVKDLLFSFFANLDVGGIEEAERNIGYGGDDALKIGRADGKLWGIVKGFDNSHYFLGSWMECHQRMREGRLLPLGGEEWRIIPFPQGILFSSSRGEYALAFPPGYKIGRDIKDKEASMWVEAQLERGKAEETWMALSWFFPHYVDRTGNRLGHYYARRFKGAREIAEYALDKRFVLLQRIVEWQDEIYSSPLLPNWLKDALINGLYPIVKNSLWIEDGRFSLSESFTGCPINETLVCRFNGSFPLLLFFPKLEKEVMREFARLQKEDGEIPFCFGMQDTFSAPVFHLQHPIVSTEFVLMAWRDYLYTKDLTFLKEVYPSAKKAMLFARTLDKNGDFLIEEDPQPGGLANQYYDAWEWHGVSAYVNTILLSALKAMERMADLMGDEEMREYAKRWFEGARAEFRRKLWNGRWFNLYSNEKTSETCLANQLVGQWYAYLCDLGEILPREEILSAVRWICALNCQASSYGVVNGVLPNGKPDETGRYHHSDGISPGEGFAYVSTAIMAGERDKGLLAGEKTYRNIALNRKSPWDIYFNYLSSTGEECWGSDYYSNMSIWTIYLALLLDAQNYPFRNSFRKENPE